MAEILRNVVGHVIGTYKIRAAGGLVGWVCECGSRSRLLYASDTAAWKRAEQHMAKVSRRRW